MPRTIAIDRHFRRDRQLIPITPTPQAARTLGVAHRSLEGLARQACHQQGRTIAPPLVARRTLQQAVVETIAPKDVEGTARSHLEAVKTVLRSRLDLDAMAAISSRLARLAQLVRVYRHRLRELGCIDAAELFWCASEGHLQRKSLFIYGYFLAPRDRLAFVDAVAGNNSVWVLPCQEGDAFEDNKQAIAALQKCGWKVEEMPAQSSPVTPIPGIYGNQNVGANGIRPPISCYRYPNLEAEVRGTLSRVKQLLNSGVSAKDIVLVAGDESVYGDTLLDIAWEYELPVRLLYRVPLRSTRLGAWIQLLFDVLQSKFAVEATAKFLGHPLSGAKLGDRWTEVCQLRPQGQKAWEEFGVDGIDFSSLTLPENATRADWVKQFQDILTAFDLRKRCGRWVRDIMAYYELQEGLATLAQPGTEPLSRDEFFADIIDSLNLLTVPARGGRGGVELHTPFAVLGANYRYIFVIGAAEGWLPKSVPPDPVLDMRDRALLSRRGLPIETIENWMRQEKFEFQNLLQIPDAEIAFSYPQVFDGEIMLPSPYVESLEVSWQRDRDTIPASIEELRKLCLLDNHQNITAENDNILPHILHCWQVEQRRESNADYDRYDGIVESAIDPQKRTFSASQLTALGQCGFKWLSSYLYKIDNAEELDIKFQGKLRGTIYHKTLEIALKLAQNSPDLLQGILDNLEAAFIEAEQLASLPELPAWEAHRQEHLDRLRRAISRGKFLSENAEVAAIERSFRGEWHGLQVKGSVDRIDIGDNGIILIDYKTSSARGNRAKDASGKATLDVQLTLYARVAARAIFPDRPFDRAYYYSLSQAKPEGTQYKLPPETELAEFADRIKTHLKKGMFPVRPDIDGKACSTCSHDLVCRRGDRLKRKPQSLRSN